MQNNYVDQNLLPDEEVLFRGKRHLFVFANSLLWLIMAIFIAVIIPKLEFLAIFPLVLAVFSGINTFIFYKFSEIAVTNIRVIVKTGWIARNSSETMIQNIAAIKVDQNIWGRMLDFGTVTIIDRGNLRTPYRFISKPFTFRMIIQTEINTRYPAPK